MVPQTKPAVVIIAFLIAGFWGGGSHLAHAFSQGAPSQACPNMRPIHGANKQTSPPPFNITLSTEEILPYQTLTVTISGIQFRGFMVTAYSSDFPLGTMIPKSDSTKLVCDDLSVTHTSQAVKTEVSFDWRAPENLVENTLVVFKATVVEERLIYWMDVVQNAPLVIVETPVVTQGPVETGSGGGEGGAGGGAADDTTDRVPAGVLPTPGTAVPVTTPTVTDVGTKSDGGGTGSRSSDGTKTQFPGHLATDAECGRTKACYHDCHADGTCTFLISWRSLDEESLAMTIRYRLPDPHQHWIAVGFSRDQEMGDDSVTECIMHDGEVKIQQSFNDGLDNRYLDDKGAALSEETGSVENGVMSCSFHRKKKYPRDPMVFDLDDDYFLLVAFGEGLNGNKLPHTFDVLPPVSPHRIDLQSLDNVHGEEAPVALLVQLHGALMMIAWVMLTSIGIMTAKYGKPMFPKVNPCGANIWFQIHRGCMAGVLVMTVAGVVVMFVQCEGYCQIPQIPGKSQGPLHPPMGLLVLMLTILNPIMAFFRPGPKAPNRFVFNWSHWGVGVLAWIMASFAVLIGLTLERAHAPPEAIYVLVTWGIYHILILVAMETLPRPLSKLYSTVVEKTLQRGRVYNLERAQQDNLGYMAEDGNTTEPTPSLDNVVVDSDKKEKPDKELTREELKVQRMLLMVHCGVVVTLTFTLLLVVFLYTPAGAP
ncbi:putative ferric-chelate reductase 1 [Babylonia areolata]|uniref:putative ferric-chelate reductase 1 n=1 Tax=Babylonia areolata TaxID=304850 RepID=UPI003FCF55DD